MTLIVGKLCNVWVIILEICLLHNDRFNEVLQSEQAVVHFSHS